MKPEPFWWISSFRVCGNLSVETERSMHWYVGFVQVVCFQGAAGEFAVGAFGVRNTQNAFFFRQISEGETFRKLVQEISFGVNVNIQIGRGACWDGF